MSKKDRQVIMTRNLIIGFISLIVILILGFGTYVSTGLVDSGEITAEQDYQILPDAKPRRPGDPIEVVEFFSYGCIHCKTFEPVLEDWYEDQADDVVLKRQPTAFSPIWALLAQSYLALESAGALEANHQRIFRAIHDARRQFLTPEMVADYVDGNDITAEGFMRAFNSPEVKRRMRQMDADQRRFRIASTPTLVVAGKYVVGMTGGQKRALSIVDHLIAEERQPKTGSDSSDNS